MKFTFRLVSCKPITVIRKVIKVLFEEKLSTFCLFTSPNRLELNLKENTNPCIYSYAHLKYYIFSIIPLTIHPNRVFITFN